MLRTALLALLVPVALLASSGTALAQAPMPATTPSLTEDPELVQRYQATITPDELAGHLYFFASDYFEGRETATPGQKMAAMYLAGQYAAMGIEPRGTLMDSSNPLERYLQPFALDADRLQRATLTVMQNGSEVAGAAFGPGAVGDQLYLGMGAAGEATAGVVFAGYGIQSTQYDDYAALGQQNIATGGQWVLVLADEPMTSDGQSLISEDGSLTVFTTSGFQKLRTAFQNGLPRGFLIVDNSPRALPSLQERGQGVLETVGSLSLAGQGGGGGFRPPPIFTISPALADQILAPSGRTVAELRSAIDETREPIVFQVPEVTVTGSVERGTAEVTSENVIAFIEGSDPALRDEVLVISSHYDHIGIDRSVSVGDRINNGADDDGSGTVALLEIAEAFQQAVRDGNGPRRSVLFLSVSGEEKGLLGSQYYADQEPVVPLENTVANLNIDMIGRYDPTYPGLATDSSYVYILGAELISTTIAEIGMQANSLTGLDLTLSDRFNDRNDPNQFFRRSDHWNFGKHGIPFIFYFTGTHEDYHGVGDEPHKIAYDRLAQITRLVFGTAWEIANRDARVTADGPGFN